MIAFALRTEDCVDCKRCDFACPIAKTFFNKKILFTFVIAIGMILTTIYSLSILHQMFLCLFYLETDAYSYCVDFHLLRVTLLKVHSNLRVSC